MDGVESDRRELKPGDLLWTKIGKYPFWPCMIAYDPSSGEYYRRIKSKDGFRFVYHVQYFGPSPQRGWTSSNIFNYEGVDKFFAKKDSSNGKKSARSICNIPNSYKEGWQIAVREADEALEISDVNERFGSFVFSYENVTKKKPLIKTAPESSSTNFALENNQEVNEEQVPPIKKMKYSTDSSVKLLCSMCMAVGAEFACSSCSKAFHMGCLGIISVPPEFNCSDCTTGFHTCFACKKVSDDLKKCEHTQCFKYYHSECLDSFRCLNSKKSICPLHVCLTCFKENPRNPMARKGLMVACVDCPSAFHLRESCIPAGSADMTPTHIKCSFHFVGKNLVSKHKPCNVIYCIECNTGGTLVCCEACPNAYHVSCLKTDVPDGEFFCEECTDKKHYYYNMIVWCKLGMYRWWPSVIVHPLEVPLAVQKVPHFDGEFPVHFLGTKYYNWTHRCRVIPYEEKHIGLKSQSKKLSFLAALEMAATQYSEYRMYRLSISLCGDYPDEYKHIKVNRYTGVKKISIKRMLIQCVCDPDEVNPCGTNTCWNRSLSIECIPKQCSSGKRCQNQRFQKRIYKPTQIIKTDGRGWGLAAAEDIKHGDFVIEYVGEVISHAEYNKRSSELQKQKIPNYYFLYLDSRCIIDAGPMGNVARFINHSCDPNCEMRKWSVNGSLRIGIFAVKDIQSGEELTFNYQSDKNNIRDFEQKCLCGAAYCTGIIGGKPQKKSKISPAALKKRKFSVSKRSGFPKIAAGRRKFTAPKKCAVSKNSAISKNASVSKKSAGSKRTVPKKFVKSSISSVNKSNSQLIKDIITGPMLKVALERLPSSLALKSCVSQQCALTSSLLPGASNPLLTDQEISSCQATSNFSPGLSDPPLLPRDTSSSNQPILTDCSSEKGNEQCVLPSMTTLNNPPSSPLKLCLLHQTISNVSSENNDNEQRVLASLPPLTNPQSPSQTESSLQANASNSSSETVSNKPGVSSRSSKLVYVPVLLESEETEQENTFMFHRCAAYQGQRKNVMKNCICFTCTVCRNIKNIRLICWGCPTTFCGDCYSRGNKFMSVVNEMPLPFYCQICSIRHMRCLK